MSDSTLFAHVKIGHFSLPRLHILSLVRSLDWLPVTVRYGFARHGEQRRQQQTSPVCLADAL
jgi:hypothetical protein